MTSPHYIRPMLAVSGRPFDSEEYWFEPKWDGIRCQLHSGPPLRLHSRSGRNITVLFPEIASADFVREADILLDGELICLDVSGRPAFDAIRSRTLLSDPQRISHAAARTPALYVAFDILFRRGEPLFRHPFEKRREILESLFIPSSVGILSPVIPEQGRALFAAVLEQKLEGIVGKERSSPYLPGQRSRAWIKCRHTRFRLLWLIGYAPHPSRGLRSIAVGDMSDQGIEYVGHVGSGIDRDTSGRLLNLLASLRVETADRYHAPPGAASGTIWVEPALRVRVEYLERTAKGHLRHPVLRGLCQSMPDEDADDA